MHFCGYNKMSLSETSLRPLNTKSKSCKHGRSYLRFSGGCLTKSFCISISTSNARISSGFSECRAFVIRVMHLIMTRRYCLSCMERLTLKSSGIASFFKSWIMHIKDCVNSLEFSNLLTSLWDSWVSSFWSSRSCCLCKDSLSMSSFSKLNDFSKKFSKDL